MKRTRKEGLFCLNSSNSKTERYLKCAQADKPYSEVREYFGQCHLDARVCFCFTPLSIID